MGEKRRGPSAAANDLGLERPHSGKQQHPREKVRAGGEWPRGASPRAQAWGFRAFLSEAEVCFHGTPLKNDPWHIYLSPRSVLYGKILPRHT